MASATWSTQQLAEFVAAVSAATNEPDAAVAAVERVAEALEADAVAIVAGHEVVAQVGYPSGEAPAAELGAVVSAAAGYSLEVPGVGPCRALAVALEHPPGAKLVVARAGVDGLTTEERVLLRGMARVASLTMRVQRILDDERAAREELDRLAREQAALHRVATLVAEVAAPEAIFSTVAEEVGRVIPEATLGLVSRYDAEGIGELVGTWSRTGAPPPVGLRFPLGGRNLHTLVFESGRAARIDHLVDDAEATVIARELGARSSAGAPIVVANRLWGVIVVASPQQNGFPDGVEHRLADFTELVATAIAKVQAREELRTLADEQAALRRVATLVARGESPGVVFTAVAEEVGRVVPVADVALVGRYDTEGALEFVGGWSADGDPSFVGTRVPLGGTNVSTLVLERNEPSRVDYDADDANPASALARQWARSSAGAPINVEGRLWGVMVVGSLQQDGLPPGVEDELAGFTELVATAIANTQAREELTAVTEWQAALRRVATRVARGEPPEAVFAAIAGELGRLFHVDATGVVRYEPDDVVTPVGSWTGTGQPAIPGERVALGGRNVTTLVHETGRAARIDGYPADDASAVTNVARGFAMRSGVGAPMHIGGRLWGSLQVATVREDPLPAATEERLQGFADLAATSIANAQAHEELRALADEQAALRRVATLVAESAPREAVFTAVAEEVGQLLSADRAYVGRYEADDTMTHLASWSATDEHLPAGIRAPGGAGTVSGLVRETGRPARVDRYAGDMYTAALAHGISSAVAAPITVDGRVWGVLGVASTGEKPPPPLETETRLSRFTDLIATAIANAEAKAELTASRARIVATADETRRRIERDLHDGAQQRLVALALRLRAARAAVPPELGELAAELDDVVGGLTGALDELREFARGIHPAILAEGGLEPALRSLARRSTVPVELEVRTGGRLSQPVEAAVYYLVSEALTNTAKHAQASSVWVEVEARDDRVRIDVRDDGAGGADLGRGSGLVGLKDRVEALGGHLAIESRAGEGTSIRAELPL